jgi:hypothetical protein
MKYTTAIMTTLTFLVVSACGHEAGRDLVGPTPHESSGAVAETGSGSIQASLMKTSVDVKGVTLPPAGFPFSPAAVITESGRGYSIMRRSDSTVKHTIQVWGLEPGHVYIYAAVVFNHPQYCVTPDHRFLDEPGPCSAFGPLMPGDGANPDVAMSVIPATAKVASKHGRVRFDVDLGELTPAFGPGLLDPHGAYIGLGLVDKGLPLPEGHPLRFVQFNVVYGGCANLPIPPPLQGPLDCGSGDAVVQHHLP